MQAPSMAWVTALELCFANLLKQKNNLSSHEVLQHLQDNCKLRSSLDDLGILLSDSRGAKLISQVGILHRKVLVCSVL